MRRIAQLHRPPCVEQQKGWETQKVHRSTLCPHGGHTRVQAIKQSVSVGRANQAKCSDRGSILRQQKGSRSTTLVLVSGAKHEGWGPTAQGIAANSAIYPLSLCFATKCIWVRNGWASSRSAVAVLIRHR